MRFANLLGASRPFADTGRNTVPSSILGPTVATPGRMTSTGSRSQSSVTRTQRGIGRDMFFENRSVLNVVSR